MHAVYVADNPLYLRCISRNLAGGDERGVRGGQSAVSAVPPAGAAIPTQTYSDLFRLTQTYSDSLRPTQTYSDLLRPTQTYSDLLRPTQTYSDLLRLTLTYPHCNFAATAQDRPLWAAVGLRPSTGIPRRSPCLSPHCQVTPSKSE